MEMENEDALFDAVESEDIEGLRAVIRGGVGANALEEALLLAVQEGFVECVKVVYCVVVEK